MTRHAPRRDTLHDLYCEVTEQPYVANKTSEDYEHSRDYWRKVMQYRKARLVDENPNTVVKKGARKLSLKRLKGWAYAYNSSAMIREGRAHGE